MALALLGTSLTALPSHADPDEQAWRAARPVNYEVIESSNDGVYLEPLTSVVTSVAEWNSLMARLQRERLLFVLPAPAAPTGVDWNREAVLLVSLGQFTELHCYLDVREVRRISYRALCDVRIDVLPGPRPQTIISPYFIVKFERRGPLRTAAARYEFYYPGSSERAPHVTYSNSDEFLNADDKVTRKVSWGGLKATP